MVGTVGYVELAGDGEPGIVVDGDIDSEAATGDVRFGSSEVVDNVAVVCIVSVDDEEDERLSLESRERVGEEVGMGLVVVEWSDEGGVLAEEPSGMKENWYQSHFFSMYNAGHRQHKLKIVKGEYVGKVRRRGVDQPTIGLRDIYAE